MHIFPFSNSIFNVVITFLFRQHVSPAPPRGQLHG